jgi:Ca2+-binding EF-hand superfamily protein
VKFQPLLALLFLVPATALAQPDDARIKQVFKAADANGDGAITLAEWTAAGRRERGFQRIDADKDGKVTLKELETAAAKMNR